MKVCAFATIKMNSQRIPKKNIQILGDKPLCQYSLEMALKIQAIEDVYVYCSDEEIKGYIPEKSIFLQREKWLDGDTIRANDTYTAFVNDVDADVYVALLTTAPFIKSTTLENALNKVLNEGYDSAFTAQRKQTFCWYQGKPINYDLTDIPRTQDLEPVFVETSGFFVFKKELWKDYHRRVGFNPYIQEVNQIEGIDIDEPEDLDFARMIVDNGLNR